MVWTDGGREPPAAASGPFRVPTVAVAVVVEDEDDEEEVVEEVVEEVKENDSRPLPPHSARHVQ